MSKKRCDWCEKDPIYVAYHDNEWGVPISDDRKWFEFLLLESFQAGLSWLTILKKRENFKQAFDGFNYHKIAQYDELKYETLINDKGIVRNKLKIKATINNAQKFILIQKEFGSFNQYMQQFINYKTIQNHFHSVDDIPAKTKLSDQISKDLKKRGFKFVGSTIIYALMQATGLVNDHIVSCYKYHDI